MEAIQFITCFLYTAQVITISPIFNGRRDIVSRRFLVKWKFGEYRSRGVNNSTSYVSRCTCKRSTGINGQVRHSDGIAEL